MTRRCSRRPNMREMAFPMTPSEVNEPSPAYRWRDRFWPIADYAPHNLMSALEHRPEKKPSENTNTTALETL